MHIIYHKHIGKKFPGLQEFEAPRFQYRQYMKVVMLSAAHTIRLYPQGYNSGSHFCYGLLFYLRFQIVSHCVNISQYITNSLQAPSPLLCLPRLDFDLITHLTRYDPQYAVSKTLSH